MESAGIASGLHDGPSALYKRPEEVAKTAVEGLENGRRVVVPGVANWLGTVVGHHTPNAVALPVLDRFYRVAE
jgi:hypothetical protein